MYTFCTIEQYLDVDHIGNVVDTLYRAILFLDHSKDLRYFSEHTLPNNSSEGQLILCYLRTWHVQSCRLQVLAK